MIYGYVSRTLNEYGLKQMREVTISASPNDLREVAAFLSEVADELDSHAVSVQFHRHLPPELKQAIGCDVIVVRPGE